MRNTKLKRSMGLWMATALVVGNMIGSGVFLLPASLAGTAGPVSMRTLYVKPRLVRLSRNCCVVNVSPLLAFVPASM